MARRLKANATRYGALVEMRVDLPIPLALRIDKKRVEKFVGLRIARIVRARLRSKLDGDGAPLYMPLDGKPAKVTGSLLRSIRYVPKLGRVEPSSTRFRKEKSSGDRVQNNYGVMSVQIHEGRWRDPMGAQSRAQQAQIVADVNQQLQAQLDSGALVARKSTRGRRRRR